MNNKEIYKIIAFAAFLLVNIYCNSSPIDAEYPINSNIREVKFSNNVNSGNFYMATWKNNTIFAIQPLSKFIIDENFNVVTDTALESTVDQKPWTYIDTNSDGSLLLLIETNTAGVSAGALFLFNVGTGELKQLYAHNNKIASARFHPLDDNIIVFYSFGDEQNKTPGYYFYDRTLKSDSLIFSYKSSAGLGETLHGFDIHPNGNSLLIPISQAKGQFDSSKPPRLGKVNLNSDQIDTLNIKFELSNVRTGLWVRYNKSGSKILYCCFPFNGFGFVTNGTSEMGIIESNSLEKRILDVNTNNESGNGSVQLAPNWSQDEKEIVYGSAQVTSSGQAGFRHLYILMNLDIK